MPQPNPPRASDPVQRAWSPSAAVESAVAALSARGSLKWSEHPGTLAAWIAESDLGTAPAVTRALRAAVDDGLLAYLPRRAVDQMAEAFTDFLAGRHGWRVDPGVVRLIPDVLAGLTFVIERLTPPGSPVIVPTPAYMPFLTVPQRSGRQVVQVPSSVVDGRWVIDLDAVDAAFRDGAGLLVLCNPHNPLGTVMTEQEHRRVAEVVERHGARVFSDEIHAPVLYEGARHVPYASVSAATAAHTVTATSASKGWNVAGLKCAQLILTSESDRATWEELDPFPVQGGSTLGVVASTAAYVDDSGWLDATVERLRSHRDLLDDLLADQLPEVGWAVRPQATYLAWLDLRSLGLPTDLAGHLRTRAGVAVTDGLACGRGGAGHVRFNYAMPPELLEASVQAIAASVQHRTPLTPAAG